MVPLLLTGTNEETSFDCDIPRHQCCNVVSGTERSLAGTSFIPLVENSHTGSSSRISPRKQSNRQKPVR